MSSPNKTELIAAIGGNNNASDRKPSVKNEINIQLGHNKTEDDNVFPDPPSTEDDGKLNKKAVAEEPVTLGQVTEEESQPEKDLKPDTPSTTSSVDESTYEQVESLPTEADNTDQEEAAPQQASDESSAVHPETQESEEDSKPVVEEKAASEKVEDVSCFTKYKKEICIVGVIGLVVCGIALKNKQE